MRREWGHLFHSFHSFPFPSLWNQEREQVTAVVEASHRPLWDWLKNEKEGERGETQVHRCNLDPLFSFVWKGIRRPPNWISLLEWNKERLSQQHLLISRNLTRDHSLLPSGQSNEPPKSASLHQSIHHQNRARNRENICGRFACQWAYPLSSIEDISRGRRGVS